jgi:two-component sensor histidine kinase
LSELAAHIIHTAMQILPADKQVGTNVPPSPIRVMPKQATSLAIVINELATNTIKYALPMLTEGRPIQITVRIKRQDGLILFEYRDNGPGYPEEVLRLERHNVGMYLVQNIVRSDLQGELTLHNDQGAVTVISFRAIE